VQEIMHGLLQDHNAMTQRLEDLQDAVDSSDERSNRAEAQVDALKEENAELKSQLADVQDQLQSREIELKAYETKVKWAQAQEKLRWVDRNHSQSFISRLEVHPTHAKKQGGSRSSSSNTCEWNTS
jgi:chromosome segregation ATPase